MAPLALVCDDEAAIRTIVAAKLRAAGYEVMEARTGAEGLDLAKQRTPSIVVTDLQMPEMNGLELCEALKRHPATAAVPAIMLTARGYALEPSQLAGTSIRKMMPKPFGARELVEAVKQVLSERQATAEAA